MARPLREIVLPSESRGLLAWAAASGTLGLLSLAHVQRGPWLLTSEEAGAIDYLPVAAAMAVAMFAVTYLALRLGAPIWIWLGPAVASAWGTLSPLVVFAGYGWAEGLERSQPALWWQILAPPLLLALPAVLAARLRTRSWHGLLPRDNRRTLASLVVFAFSILAVNGVSAELANGGFAWAVGPLRDDQALGAFFAANIIGPLLIAFALSALRVAPPGAWLVVVVPALCYSLVGLAGGTIGEFLMYLWFLTPLAVAVVVGSVAGSWLAGLRE